MDPIKRGLEHELADIKRRLEVIERSGGLVQRLGVASDDPEELAVELGALSDQSDTSNKDSIADNGTIGLGVYAYDGTERYTLLKASETHGLERPWLQSSWRDPAAYTNITAGSWTTLFVTDIYMLAADTIATNLQAYAPVGTTIAFRLNLHNGAATTDTMTEVGDGSTNLRKFRWLHGELMNAGTYQLKLQGYRVSGAGTGQVYWPSDIARGSGFVGATSGGVYQ